MTNKFSKLYEGNDFEPEKKQQKKRDVLLDESVKSKLKKVSKLLKKKCIKTKS